MKTPSLPTRFLSFESISVLEAYESKLPKSYETEREDRSRTFRVIIQLATELPFLIRVPRIFDTNNRLEIAKFLFLKPKSRTLINLTVHRDNKFSAVRVNINHRYANIAKKKKSTGRKNFNLFLMSNFLVAVPMRLVLC